MTTDRLVAKVQGFLGLKKHKQIEKREKMFRLLKKLKQQQTELQKTLDSAGEGDKTKRLKRDIKLLHEHRKKAARLCRKIGCSDERN